MPTVISAGVASGGTGGALSAAPDRYLGRCARDGLGRHGQIGGGWRDCRRRRSRFRIDEHDADTDQGGQPDRYGEGLPQPAHLLDRIRRDRHHELALGQPLLKHVRLDHRLRDNRRAVNYPERDCHGALLADEILVAPRRQQIGELEAQRLRSDALRPRPTDRRVGPIRIAADMQQVERQMAEAVALTSGVGAVAIDLDIADWQGRLIDRVLDEPFQDLGNVGEVRRAPAHGVTAEPTRSATHIRAQALVPAQRGSRSVVAAAGGRARAADALVRTSTVPIWTCTGAG